MKFYYCEIDRKNLVIDDTAHASCGSNASAIVTYPANNVFSHNEVLPMRNFRIFRS